MKKVHTLIQILLIASASVAIVILGCHPKDYGKLLPNQPPTVRLANVPPNDPAEDTTGNDGHWNASTDDVGSDGIPDPMEVGCRGAYDPVTNPDPNNDDYDTVGFVSCGPDSGMPKSDRNKFTEKNGLPNVGEPHVSALRPFKSPLVKLYWIGNDPDGYVTAFMYRWTFKDKYSDTVFKVHPWTTLLNYVTYDNRIIVLDVSEAQAPEAASVVLKYFTNADLDPDRRNPSSPSYDTALVNTYTRLALGKEVLIKGYLVYAANPDGNRYPVHASPNSGNFTFESDDFMNRHKFEIKSIDNERAVGGIDSVKFWTPDVEPPRTYFVYYPKGSVPDTSDTLFVLDKITDTWPGVIFTFNGSDRNSRTLSYSWKVDSKDWTPEVTSAPGKDYKAYLTSADMDTPFTGRHTFKVRARNEFGKLTAESGQPTSSFVTVYPPFAIEGMAKRLLLIDVNRNTPVNQRLKSVPSDTAMMKFYDDIFTALNVRHDLWDPHHLGHPSFGKLAEYSSVYIITDNTPPGDIYAMIDPQKYVKYLGAGGSMMFNTVINQPVLVFREGEADLVVNRFQLRDIDQTFVKDQPYDCAGAFGWPKIGYPDLQVDPDKCDDTLVTRRSLAYAGAVANVSVCQPQGYAEVIYLFDSKRDSVASGFGEGYTFEKNICGIRYMGPTYRSIWFGIPMWFMKKDQVQAAMQKAMYEDLQYH